MSGFRRLTAAGLVWVLLCAYPAAVSFCEDSGDFAAAVVAYNDRRLDDALGCAKKAVRENPRHVDALALLGELYYLKQDLSQAKETWEKALKLAPSRQDVRQRLSQLQRESPVEKNLARSDTYPFVVRFDEGQMPVDLGELRLLLRDTYRLVGQQFDYFPNHTVTVILYPQVGFNQIKQLIHAAVGLYDGKIRLPIPQNLAGSGIPVSQELKRVLWHEYTHALVHDLSKGQCPIWLNEGLASLQESRVYNIQLDDFRGALNSGVLFRWEQFWNQPYDPKQLALQYQQAYMMAGYLVKRWGWSKMVVLLKRLGEGYPIEDAIRAEYKAEPAVLEKEWLVWLKRNM